MKARAIPRPLRGWHETGCVVCGRPLVYSGRTQERECCVCHRVLPSDAVCEAGHFVCDDCHSGGGAALLAFLQDSRERDPVKLFLNACALPGVHMHGPEHHGIVPCVLLTACANCGLELDLPAALAEAWARGKRLPGGSCGALGVCGAAAGAGIFASIACGASPLAAEPWAAAQRLVSDCLARIAAVGGPRCCKRTGRLSIEAAADFARRELGVDMPASRPSSTPTRPSGPTASSAFTASGPKSPRSASKRRTTSAAPITATTPATSGASPRTTISASTPAGSE